MENNEAKAVIWTEGKTPGGFVVSITKRGDDLQTVFDQLGQFCKDNNITPHERYGGQAKSAPKLFPEVDPNALKKCEVHGLQMKQFISKNTGKPYFSHSQREGETWRKCFGKGFID